MTENQERIIVIILAFIFIFLGLTFLGAEGRVWGEEVFTASETGYYRSTPNGWKIVVSVDMEIIKQIESGGNPHAYNKISGATGLYQITPICLEDFNIYYWCEYVKDISIDGSCEKNKMVMDAMYSPKNNWMVANWYMNTRIPQLLKHFKHEDTLKNRLTAYNCGIGCVGKNLPRETKRYIKKYRRLVND